jgi:hypothetical protein
MVDMGNFHANEQENSPRFFEDSPRTGGSDPGVGST